LKQRGRRRRLKATHARMLITVAWRALCFDLGTQAAPHEERTGEEHRS